MAQSVGTKNFLIRDPSGKPQVIKILQTGGNKTWHIDDSPQPSVVRHNSNLVRTVSRSSLVKRLYNDDDSDSASSSLVVRRAKTIQTTNTPGYKVVRRPENLQNVYQTPSSDNESIQSMSDSSTRYSSGQKRVSKERSVPTQSKKIPADFETFESVFVGKRRRSEKGGKGLRHFSMKVCQKVKQKGVTTYNEVADELVAEFTGCSFQPNIEQNYDQKNIRRRVYDALNVLMAMNIISKEKKEIRWLGLPSGFPKTEKSDRDQYEEERVIMQRIAHKKKTLQNLILQQVAFKNLVERNKAMELVRGPLAPSATIQLPMLVVSTNQNTTVNLSVSNDRKEYFFNFDDVFEIKDESHVLQTMGMMMGLNTGDATPEDLIRAKTMIPRALAPYLEEMVQSNVQGETSGSLYGVTRDEADEDDGAVYLEEDDDSATDDDMETH